MPPPGVGNEAIVRLIRAHNVTRDAADANGPRPLATERVIVDERPPDAEASVSRVKKRSKGKAILQFDFEDVDPPQCVQCDKSAWPAYTSAAGKSHCSQCRPESQGMPVCAFCHKKTWNGMFRGIKLCAQGKGIVCKSCWLSNSEEDERPKWAAWFAQREKAYPGAFPEDHDI